MLLRVCLKLLSPFQRTFNLNGRYRAFLGQAISKNCHVPSVKKIQDTVLDMSMLGTKFVNAIPQKIRCWTSQLMTKLDKEHNSRPAIRPGFLILIA
jgi:hypothetical protein